MPFIIGCLLVFGLKPLSAGACTNDDTFSVTYDTDLSANDTGVVAVDAADLENVYGLSAGSLCVASTETTVNTNNQANRRRRRGTGSTNVQVQAEVTIVIQITIYIQIQYSAEVADDEKQRQSVRDGCLSKIKNTGPCSFPVQCNGKPKKRCKTKVPHVCNYCAPPEKTTTTTTTELPLCPEEDEPL